MRRPLLTGVAGVALLALGLTGCGIPASTDVEVERRVSTAGAGSVSGGSLQPPARTAAGSNAQTFVNNFLAAAAGEPDRAYDRVKEFIDPRHHDRLQEKQGSEVALTVVRLTDDPVITPDVDSTKVTINVQQVGLLRANGTLLPPVATERSYEFKLVSAAVPGQGDVEQAGLYVQDPPNALLLSDVALAQYYKESSVYFWSSDRARLVPDLRYLPEAVPEERQVTEVVRWLIGGPSDWLRTAVVPLPDRTELINNATGSADRWEVNLALPANDEERLDQFATQLAWSLPNLDGQVELKVQNQSRRVVDLAGQRRANPVYELAQNPHRFCVYDGAVHPLAVVGEPGTVPLAEGDNRNVVSANFDRINDRTLAALVVTGPDKRQRLAVGSGAAPLAGLRKGPVHTAVGRPVWLRTLDPLQPRGLVVADGSLYLFDRDARMSRVQLNGVTGAVTAVAASLDGQRIALIVGGGLYVAAVDMDGDSVTVGPARRVFTSLTALSAVDWAGEDRLVVGGSTDRPAVYDVSVDGARQTALQENVGARVTHLVAYPVNPVAPQPSAVMYEANGVSYSGSTRIQSDQVLDVNPDPTGDRSGNPTAPFFLY
ncbi:LpqB family beta-propeller domain-containing protein [Micromonospora sp. C28SCA-DRY-2]|uniref:LpqB family beta-propeller domain-containing protein n=1 Tax=Micromonospora sp. C28SCA-DRY-2 TaxID=3059522 RepID=UPI002674C7A1|nr:LpqB family beta-propeller domain-containing protein [Micromonospora sp. C28SCA-DRY-2]MDO3701045.1 LpqB family beta-propeller domain-containing protein [Micromonospora sp. C28SCA-DRY-2]